MRFESPTTIDAAVALLSTGPDNAQVLGGGTDLLVKMRSGFLSPDLVVDIKRIAGMRDITEENGGFRIGAGVCGAEMGEHEGLCAAWPGIVEGMELIGSTQVQGRATLAGNLCNASPAADSVPAMVTASVTARVAGPSGERDVPVADIPTGPGKTSLARGEFITSFFLPKPIGADAYLRFIPRTEMDIAVVGCAVNLALSSDGKISEAHVVLGAVGPKVIIVDEAAAAITGTDLDDATIAKLQDICAAAATPISDKRGTVEFRRTVSGVLGKRVAQTAYARALARLNGDTSPAKRTH